MRYAESLVAQHTVHQFVGQQLGPVRPDRDWRLQSGPPDDFVTLVGVLGILVIDDGQPGIEDAWTARSVSCRRLTKVHSRSISRDMRAFSRDA